MLNVYARNCQKYFVFQTSILTSTIAVRFLHVCLALMLAVQETGGYPGGAPLLACKSMFPSGHETTPQSTQPPYRVTIPVKTYTPGATVKVTLEATDDYFKGLFMQAREVGCRVNYTQTVGVFQTTDYGLKTTHCFGTVHSAVSHSTNSKKKIISVYWTAPTVASGHVVIRATVVKERDIFWTNVDSEVMVDLESLDTPKCLFGTVRPLSDMNDNSPYDMERVALTPVSAGRIQSCQVLPVLSILCLLFIWSW